MPRKSPSKSGEAQPNKSPKRRRAPEEVATGTRADIQQALRGCTGPAVLQAGGTGFLVPQRMQDEMEIFLGEHLLAVMTSNADHAAQAIWLTSAYRETGDKVNDLTGQRPPLSSQVKIALAPVRLGLSQPFLDLLKTHYQELERRLTDLIRSIATGGVQALIDQEGFRKEEFLKAMRELLQFMSNDFRRLLKPPGLAIPGPHLAQHVSDFSRAQLPQDLADLRSALRPMLTPNPSQADRQEFERLLKRQSVDLERANGKVEWARGVDKRHHQFVNREDGMDNLLEQWLIQVMDQWLQEDPPDLDKIRRQLLILIRQDLTHRGNALAAQLLPNLTPAQPDPKVPSDDLRGTAQIDFGNAFSQPHARLGTVECLLRYLNSALRQMQTVLRIKTYLGFYE